MDLQKEPAKKLARELSTIPAVKDIMRDWMKQGKFPTVSNIDAKWITARLKSKELMNAELLTILDTAKRNMPEERYIYLIKPYIDAMNAVHGEKIDVNISHVMMGDIKNFFDEKVIDAEIVKNDN